MSKHDFLVGNPIEIEKVVIVPKEELKPYKLNEQVQPMLADYLRDMNMERAQRNFLEQAQRQTRELLMAQDAYNQNAQWRNQMNANQYGIYQDQLNNRNYGLQSAQYSGNIQDAISPSMWESLANTPPIMRGEST